MSDEHWPRRAMRPHRLRFRAVGASYDELGNAYDEWQDYGIFRHQTEQQHRACTVMLSAAAEIGLTCTESP